MRIRLTRFSWRSGSLALIALCAFGGHADAQRPGASYRVLKDCGRTARCFATIQAAVDAAGSMRQGDWVSIEVGPGDFREKVVVTRGKMRLIGRGIARTRVHFDAVAEHAGTFDRDGWGTAGSATLIVDGDEVVVRDMTIENDFDYLANDALPDGDARKIGNSQGVAVQLDVHSDRVLFDRVALLGYQDTLFTRGNRALIRHATIAGNVDFIFGSGTLLIEESEIRSRRRAVATAPGDYASFVAAPSTPLSRPVGIVFSRSRLTREAGVADGSVALARPWHPTTRFPDGRYADPNAVGQAALIDCFLDAHIHPSHWTSMAGTARDGTKTQIFRPEDSRFSESGSYGPGAGTVAANRTRIDPALIVETRAAILSSDQGR
ncbi:pectinesterase family protein [Sphingomonas sp. BIUV-7]|uniref:Pectinesterase family protein n=1 Tax=Sphingomonas natans TaxID=3063330 RepID=A0ABT8Y5E8_9SPHN|nr:pectinesterase family protein [Sphingomonas sp. BIUV-7]MDO6413551.1 pectinesterase family protein [Sphingomonas sp. BIUV-7]